MKRKGEGDENREVIRGKVTLALVVHKMNFGFYA